MSCNGGYKNLKREAIVDREKSSSIRIRANTNEQLRELFRRYVRPPSSRPRILDAGCGQGGSVWRWRAMHASHVVMFDPCEESLKEATSRATTARLSSEVYNDTIEKWMAQTSGKEAYDVIYMGQVVHYLDWSQTQSTAQSLLRAVSSSLKKDGFWVVFDVDAYALAYAFKSEGRVKTREISITHKKNEAWPQYEANVGDRVTKSVESVVPFDLLSCLAVTEYNLRPICKRPIDDGPSGVGINAVWIFKRFSS